MVEGFCQTVKGNTSPRYNREHSPVHDKLVQELLVFDLFTNPGVEIANKDEYSNAIALRLTENPCLAVTIYISHQNRPRQGKTCTYCE